MLARAQVKKEARMVPHGDLNILDPIWTTQNMAAYHGAMMYDTLFGIDANFNPQPQMVGKTDISADKKTYTFELRPGLTAQVDIKARERTVLDYLTKPIVKTLSESLGAR